jgi:RecA/RadA recombinase
MLEFSQKTARPAKNGSISKNSGVEQTVTASGRRGMDTLERRIAPGAFHNSGEKFDPPKCQPRTRTAILSSILAWLNDVGKDFAMLWLYGPTGSGKSAIAQTIAQYCHEQGFLVASFFFSKGQAGRNSEKHFMATIAYQIALSIPDTRRYISQAVENDPSVFSGSLESQLQTLIVNPLSQAYAALGDKKGPVKKWARLLVIDGLDACQGPNTQRYIVRILSTALIHKKIPLFILVSSRPEPPIRDSFNSYDLRDIISTLVLDESYLPDTDIKRYFWGRFDNIKQTHPLRTYIPANWPSSQTINSLVQKASGQFIYASTVIKYVDSAQHRPVERLDAVLRISNPVGDTPFAELDCLYRHVFASVHNIKTVLRILGALLFGQRLYSKKSASGTMELAIPITDPRFLEELLSLNRGDVYFALGDLHSILNVPDPRRSSASSDSKPLDAGIRIIHSSLIDFLTDRSRAGRYFINSVKVHAELARACTKNLLSGHKFVHQYSGQALVTHCRYSVLTHELLNDLLSFDLSIWMTTCKTWNDGGGPFDQAWTELPHLFQWFRTQTYPDPQKGLYDRHMLSWDQYLHAELKNYSADEYLMDLLAFVTYPHLLWDWIHVWPLLGLSHSETSEREGIDRRALHLTGLKQSFDAYRHMLSQFLADRDRSGRYAMTSNTYARVAFRITKYLFEPKRPGKIYEYKLPSEWQWYRQEHDDKIFRERKAKETFQAGLQYLPFFLTEAAPLPELVAYLETNQLDPIRAKELPREAWAVDKAKVEEEVTAYLQKCKGDKDVAMQS